MGALRGMGREIKDMTRAAKDLETYPVTLKTRLRNVKRVVFAWKVRMVMFTDALARVVDKVQDLLEINACMITLIFIRAWWERSGDVSFFYQRDYIDTAHKTT